MYDEFMVDLKNLKTIPASDTTKLATPPKNALSPKQRRDRVRNATKGLKAGVTVTKAMYRPGSG
jgi:hypothetical protein